MGAGFLVSEHEILTCAHVVESALGTPGGTVLVDFPLLADDHQALAAEVDPKRLKRRESEIDAMVLRLAPGALLPPGARPATLRRDPALEGHRWKAFGFPEGYDGPVSAGGEIRDNLKLNWQLEGVRPTGYPVIGGFSGGPVWDAELRAVVGMIYLAETNTSVRAAFMYDASVLAEAGAPVALSSAATRDPVHMRLESYLTSFIGRDKELSDLEEQYLPSKRLVTLTGITGMGKTRLALRAVADVEDRFAHGVSYVDLGNSSGPALAEVVASELGVQGDLGEFMRSRDALLVLDTCDHRVGPCRDFAMKLLKDNPKLHILATCQQSLRIEGEQKYPIPPLRTPSRQVLDAVRAGHASPHLLGRYEAVQLFLDRASHENPHFTPSDDELVQIGEVCLRLDGIPALVEMAAKRSGHISVENLAAQLKSAVPVADGPKPSRHQTVNAMMDWMSRSLDPEEARLLLRLSVFAEGWTDEAARAVAAGTPLRPEEMDARLNGLIDKSMIEADRTGSRSRYRMLRMVREYASARLKELSEAESVRALHCDYFLQLAERSQPFHAGVEEAVWMGDLEAEHDNLRAALEWAVRRRKTEKALRLAGALFWFWNFRGYISEGRFRVKQALALKPARDTRARARALYAAGALAWMGGDPVAARSQLQASIAMAQAPGDEQTRAYALVALGQLRMGDEPDDALAHETEALALFRRLGDGWGEALAQHDLGNVLNRQGRAREARERYELSRVGFKKARSRWGQALALNDLAATAQSSGRFEEARGNYREAARLCRELRDRPYLAAVLIKLGHLQRGPDRDDAIELFKESLQLSHEIGNDTMFRGSLSGLAQLAHDTGRTRLAVCLLAAVRASLDENAGEPGFDSTAFERTRSLARALLDAAEFEAARAEGYAMNSAQARTYALQQFEEAAPPPSGPPS